MKVKNTPLTYGTEKASARQEHRLPEGLPTTKPGVELSNETTRNATLAFLLTDIVYTLLFDTTVEMQSKGRDIKHDSRRRFNQFFADIERAKTSTLRASRDVQHLNEAMQEYYINDSDWLREVLELIYDRSKATPDAKDRIKAVLFNFPKFKP